MQKILFFQKGVDKISRKVFHTPKPKNKKTRLDFAGFSTLSTEFSIGYGEFFGVGMENFLENRLCES